MRDWIDQHGARFGWRKTEALSEWWHVSYVGGVSFPVFESLRRGSRGKRVVRYSRRLAYLRQPGGPRYLKRWYYKFKLPVAAAVMQFQRDQRLSVDGVIGPRTAARINAAFKHQWKRRGN